MLHTGENVFWSDTRRIFLFAFLSEPSVLPHRNLARADDPAASKRNSPTFGARQQFKRFSAAQFQVLLLPQARDTLGVHLPTRPEQQPVNPFAAKTRIRLAPATQFLDQPAIIIRLPTTVTLRRARLPQHAAEPSLRNVVWNRATADQLFRPASSLGDYPFGWAASRRI